MTTAPESARPTTTPRADAPATPQQASAAPRAEAEKDAALTQIRDLIYGESKRELDDRIEHMIDRQREFEDAARREMRKMAEDFRSAERRAEDARRTMLKELSETVETMAKTIAKLAE